MSCHVGFLFVFHLQCLARHLAELFIRGVSKSTYEPFDMAACGVPSCGQKPHIYGADR